MWHTEAEASTRRLRAEQIGVEGARGTDPGDSRSESCRLGSEAEERSQRGAEAHEPAATRLAGLAETDDSVVESRNQRSRPSHDVVAVFFPSSSFCSGEQL